MKEFHQVCGLQSITVSLKQQLEYQQALNCYPNTG